MNKTIVAVLGALALFSSIAKANWIEITSLRGYTDASNLLIAYFSLSEPETVIVLGLGPSLGIPNHMGLTDPAFSVADYSRGLLVGTNNDWWWPAPPDLGNLTPEFVSEAAWRKDDLPEGNYGVLLGGLAGTAGIAQIEVYVKSVPDAGDTAAMLAFSFMLTAIFSHRIIAMR